jgi:CRISPR-associated endonuclease/helicase Cas3
MSVPSITLADCWAKTFPKGHPREGHPALTVRDHCLIVGAVAETVFAILPAATRSILPAGTIPLTALHDVGKLTAGFLAQCEFWKIAQGSSINRMQNGCRKHAWVSQIDLEPRLGSAKRWAIALGGHHGRFSLTSPVPEHPLSRRAFQPLRDELTNELVKLFGPLPSTIPLGGSDLAEFPHIAALCGFIILCDWLGSDEENFPLLSTGLDSPPLEKTAAFTGATAAVSRRQLDQPAILPDLPFDELFTPPGESAYRPNTLQTECAAHILEPGLHLIEAPMGMGKTEAALWVAAGLISSGKASGLYFALPTQLTSNKIHERVGAFLHKALPSSGTLALAHAASWLESPAKFRIAAGPGEEGDRTDAAAARTWFTSRRALLARYGVGTIDQALMAALPVKFAALRLFGLAAKVVVLDEVHTYDAYTAKLLDRLIQHLLALRCTVIVLSATLTKSRRAELLRLATPEVLDLPDDYPLLSSCETGGKVKPISVPYPDDLPSHKITIRRIGLPDPSLPEPLLEEIQSRARRGERVLVIRNTVALAQETFAALRMDGIESGLLHSRFPFHARNGHPDEKFRDPEFPAGREVKWVSRLGKSGPLRPGCILVATQVAEQSLDIDADLLVTDLCPADMLLQRTGRLWRHPRHRPTAVRPCPHPETWVLVPELPADADADQLHRSFLPHSAVYDAYTLLRTLRELPEVLPIPGGIRRFLEASYAALPNEPSAWTELRDRMEDEIQKKSDQAGLLTANPYLSPFEDDDSKAPTRYRDQPTVDLVLLAAEPRTQPGGTLELRFHSGETLAFHRGAPWTFPIARTVFLSTVRVARRQIGKTPPPSDWLALHSHGPVVAAWLDGATLRDLETGSALPFRFEPDRGLIFSPESAEISERCSDETLFDDDYPF